MHLLDILDFGEKGGIGFCFSIWTIRFSTMVNRSIIGFSNSSRRLRQGDPFSMVFLILDMEVHNRMLHNTVEGGYLVAFQVGELSFICHDTILFVR
jgi:hypothetical protein